LPQAIVNYLLLLGWHPGTTQEIFNFSEVIKEFKLEGLHARGAVYDLEKLNWYNNHYIQQLAENEFAEYSWQVIKKAYKLSVEKKEQVVQIALLFRPQLNYFQELVNLTNYFFQRPNQQSFAKSQSNHLWLAELIKKLEKTEE
jgi:glutamyl/glutaminyl-tRNA synthetase